MFKFLRNIDNKNYKPGYGGLGIFKFIGPGLLVTVGFIDPGNWASDLAAGSDYGYVLLWVVTLSTIMLVILQHNVAHLGIATGLCLSEAATIYLKPRYSKILLSSANIDWNSAISGWVVPSFPKGSIIIIMSVLGAVVMPHNLFLHSEIIQSRQWNLKDEKIIKKQLKFEFFDTLFSMIIGWAINSAMILLAAATFFKSRTPVSELEQAEQLLAPLLGNHAPIVFAIALLFAGLASTITSGMAAGSIFSGMFREPYDISLIH